MPAVHSICAKFLQKPRLYIILPNMNSVEQTKYDKVTDGATVSVLVTFLVAIYCMLWKEGTGQIWQLIIMHLL